MFSHRTTRYPLTALLVFAFSSAVLLAAFVWPVPWWVMLPLAFAAGEAGYRLVYRSRSGIDLDDVALVVHGGRRPQRLRLIDIDRVCIADEEGQARAEAVLRSGERVDLPSRVCPAAGTFADALRRYGVRVERA